MAEWVSLHGSEFVAADVIRWKEGVYKPRRSKKRKAMRLGDCLVTAKVLKEPDAKGWVRLLVRKWEVLSTLPASGARGPCSGDA